MSSIVTLTIDRHDGRALAVCADGALYSLSFPAALLLLGELREAAVIERVEFTPAAEHLSLQVPNPYGVLLDSASAMTEVHA